MLLFFFIVLFLFVCLFVCLLLFFCLFLFFFLFFVFVLCFAFLMFPCLWIVNSGLPIRFFLTFYYHHFLDFTKTYFDNSLHVRWNQSNSRTPQIYALHLSIYEAKAWIVVPEFTPLVSLNSSVCNQCMIKSHDSVVLFSIK